MTESAEGKKRGLLEERHELSAFIVRSLMTFLGTVGALGCLMSGLGFSFKTGAFDIAVSLASVLFTYIMLRTGYHPYCAGAGAALCLIFGLIRISFVSSGIAEIASRYVLAETEGTEALAKLPDSAGSLYAFMITRMY